jgi:hypothetical protein
MIQITCWPNHFPHTTCERRGGSPEEPFRMYTRRVAPLQTPRSLHVELRQGERKSTRGREEMRVKSDT